MSVTILITRTIPPDKTKDVLNLIRKMRSLATAQDGYISGETLKSRDRRDVYLVISTWESEDYWEKWLRNKKRKKIQGKIDDLLGGKTAYELLFYNL